MKKWVRYLIPAPIVAVLVVVMALRVLAGQSHPAAPALARAVHQSQFGRILVTAKQQALYNFTPEKDGTIHCTGSCATVWPPLLVPAGATVAAHIPGATGTFGTIVRPDQTRQLTFQGRPLYTYTGDTHPLQVLCNGVDGWFVVTVH